MSARTLPALLLLGLWFVIGTGSVHAELRYETTQVVTTNYIIMTVQYAYDGEQVKFAVFHFSYAEPGLKCKVVYSLRDDRKTPLTATLEQNDNTPTNLLKTGGIYRVDNGFVEEVDLNFKTSELREFLNGNNCDITFDEFLAHLRRKNV